MSITLNNIADLRTYYRYRFPSAVLVHGYATPGDGGGGTFLWHAGATEDDDSATIIVPDREPRGGGRWKRIYSGMLNYLWFGGSPTGASVSNRTALQNAVDRATALGMSVHVPAGVYPINLDSSGGIVVPDGMKVRIYGDGKDLSIFTMPDQQMGAVVCFAPGINSVLELDGITIEGPEPNTLQQSSCCIETDEPCHVILRDARIGVAGLAFRKCIAFTSGVDLYRLEIENHSELRAYGEAVVYVNGGAGSEVRLFDSTFHNENDTRMVFPTARSPYTGHGIQTGDPVAVLAVGCHITKTWTPPVGPAGGYAFYPLISDNSTTTAPPKYYAIINCWLEGVKQGIMAHQHHLDPITGATVQVPTLVQGCIIEGDAIDKTYTGLLFRVRGHLMILNTIVRGCGSGGWVLAFDPISDTTSRLSIEGCDFSGEWPGGGIIYNGSHSPLWRIADSSLENDSTNVVWCYSTGNFEIDRVRILRRVPGNAVFAQGGKWYIRDSTFTDANVEANTNATTLKLIGNRFQGRNSVLNLSTTTHPTILKGSDNMFEGDAHLDIRSANVIGHLKPPDGINPTPILAASETRLHPNFTDQQIRATGATINTFEIQVTVGDPTARRGFSGPFVLIFLGSITVAHDTGGEGGVLLQSAANHTFPANSTLTLIYDSVAGKWRELTRSIV